MGIREQRADALKSAHRIVAADKDAGRGLTDDEKASYDEIMVKIAGFDERLDVIRRDEQLTAQLDGLGSAKGGRDGDNLPARTLGDHFVKTVGERLAKAHRTGGQFSISSLDFKAASTVHTRPESGLDIVDYDRNIATSRLNRLTIADITGAGTVSGSAIKFWLEGAAEGSPGLVAENAKKAQVHFNTAPKTKALQTIAAFIKESDEIAEDMPFLVSAINDRLLYELAMAEEDILLNDSSTLVGFLETSGVQSASVTGTGQSSAVADADIADAIFAAIMNVQSVGSMDADAIVLNPATYQRLRLAKDNNNGQYFGGGWFTGQYGNGNLSLYPPLWGLPTVVTSNINANHVLIGAFRQGATVYRKGGVRVEVANTNEDDFIYDRMTIRAQERLTLAVRRPSAFVDLDIS